MKTNPQLIDIKSSKANNSAMVKLLQVKERGRRAQKAKHSDVIAAREIIQKASEQFNSNPTEENRISRNSSKESLFAVYDRITEEDLAENLVDAERAHCSQQHSLGWNLINEVNSRKLSSKRQN